MNKKRSAGLARTGGYTVVELMVAASIAGILAAVAIPAFDNVIRNNRRAVVVNELLATLLLARTEAAKRGQNLVLCGVDDANRNRVLDDDERGCVGHDWSDGWILSIWSDTDGDNVVDNGELSAVRQYVNDYGGSLWVSAPTFMAGASPPGSAVVRPFSRRSSNGTVTVCDARGTAHARALILAPNGRARISSRKADGAPLSCP